MKRRSIFIGAAAMVIVIGLCYFFIMRNTGDTQDQYKIPSTQTQANAIPDAAKQNDTAPAVQGGNSLKDKFENMGISIEDQLVKELQKYYGNSISKKSTQASIYEIRNSFLGSHPDEGKAMFQSVLKRAFPDLADEIMKTLDKLDLYNRWLKENEPRLSQMTAEEKKAALWEKRIELFGEDAKEIWTDEMMATDARKAKMKDVMAFINESHDTTLEEKLQSYQDVLEETYKGSPEEYLLDQKPVLATVFFSIDSVQDELKQMSPDQRQMAINKIRREMGFTQEQVEGMEDTRRGQ